MYSHLTSQIVVIRNIKYNSKYINPCLYDQTGLTLEVLTCLSKKKMHAIM